MKILQRLWTKLSLAIIFLLIIIMSMVTYFSTVRQSRVQRDEFRTNMKRIAQQIASIRFAETEGWYTYQNWIDNIIASNVGEDLVYIAIFDEKDSLTASALNRQWLDLGNTTYFTVEEQRDIVERLVSGQVAEESENDFDHIPINIRWGDEFLGTVDVGFSLIELNNRVRLRLLISLGFLALSCVFGMLAAVLISHRITRPLNKLSQAILKVARGDTPQQIAVTSRDEIGELTSAFNTMVIGLQEKTFIDQFSHKLGFTYELDRLMELIITEISSALQAEKGILVLLDQKSKNIIPIRCSHYKTGGAVNIRHHTSFKWLQESVQDNILIHSQSIFHPEWLRLRKRMVDWPRETWLIPIRNNEGIMGLFILANPNMQLQSIQETKKYISTLIGQAGLALENVLLLMELTEQERMKKELEIAREVQKRLLPVYTPQMDSLDISGICIPATEVGGDYFDFIQLSEDRLAIVVADVSGKGTSAAFYMAEIKGMITSLAHIYQKPKEVALKINEKLYDKPDRRVFATMIYGVLDLTARRFDFVRSGHIALVMKKNKPTSHVDFLIPSGIGLGLTNNDIFLETLEEKTIYLAANDILVLCTDGVTEAMDVKKMEFGENRLSDVLMRSRADTMENLQKSILAELKQFVRNAPPHDDVTLVLVKVA
ncbi:SpoIIE family protein phosphatase [candidate division KSB1 bacterium]|nr:SpoIIE family protein phosphatase [candidate division KSB1 bacterium]